MARSTLLVVLLGCCGCGAMRDYAKEQGTLAAKEVLASYMETQAAKYVTADQLLAWKTAADVDKSGEVSPNEWWDWVKDNWEIALYLVGFGYLQQRAKRKTGQIWEKISEIEVRTPPSA